MVGFQHVATITQGYVGNVSDLTLGQVGGQVVLVGVTYAGGGVSIWGVDGAGVMPRLLGDYEYHRKLTHLADPQAVLLDRPGGVSLLAAGLKQASGQVHVLSETGRGAADRGFVDSALPADLLHAGSFTTASGLSLVYGSTRGQAAVTLWQQQPNGRLVQGDSTAPPPGLPADAQIDAILPLRVGGLDLLVSASTRGNFIASHRVRPDGTLEPAELFGADSGTGFNGPRDIAAVEVAGRHYLVVSSAQSSSLTTVRVLPDGALIPVDHVIDELTTRFRNATVMETVTIDGRAYILAGGNDDGLSLFTLSPDGRLIHLDTIADQAETTLLDVSALAVRAVGGKIVVFAASQVEQGISQFVIDPGPIGQTMQVGPGLHDGTAGNDLIQGGTGTTRINGGDGDDILIAGSRSVWLYGGNGADTFIPLPIAGKVMIGDYEPGIDRIDLSMLGMIRSVQQLRFQPLPDGISLRFGETIIDVHTRDGQRLDASHFDNSLFPITHYQPPDVRSTIHGTAIGDVLTASRGGSTIYGYGGDDTIFGSDLDDFIHGGMGNDSIVAGAGDDTIWGGAGNDLIRGGDGDDLILGGDGNDSIWGEDGDDLIGGEGGNDRIYGGAGNDRINGGAGDDYIEGGPGNDRLFGMAGNDTMVGGPGDDLLLDLHGDNVFIDHEGNNMMFGGAGNDRFHAGDGDDTIRGGGGNDWIEAGGGRDNILGGAGHDTIYGGAGDDLILGGPGRDLIYGGAGNDLIFGGEDEDLLYGDDGDDFIYGEGGNDTIYGGAGNDTLRGNGGDDLLYGGAGNDRMFGGTGHDTLYGDDGDDLMLGEGGNDVLYGGDGNDTLDGGWNDDLLYGGAGNDRLLGGPGNDTLHGGPGADRMTGGDGADVFVFEAADSRPGAEDVITDFTPGEDLLQFTGLGLVSIGSDAFSGSAGQLRWSLRGNLTVVEADLDGDGIADLSILLEKAPLLSDTDFIL